MNGPGGRIEGYDVALNQQRFPNLFFATLGEFVTNLLMTMTPRKQYVFNMLNEIIK